VVAAVSEAALAISATPEKRRPFAAQGKTRPSCSMIGSSRFFALHRKSGGKTAALQTRPRLKLSLTFRAQTQAAP